MEEAGRTRSYKPHRTITQLTTTVLHCAPIIHLRLRDDTPELQSLDNETCRFRVEQLGRVAHLSSRRIRRGWMRDDTLIGAIETGLI